MSAEYALCCHPRKPIRPTVREPVEAMALEPSRSTLSSEKLRLPLPPSTARDSRWSWRSTHTAIDAGMTASIRMISGVIRSAMLIGSTARAAIPRRIQAVHNGDADDRVGPVVATRSKQEQQMFVVYAR